MTAPAIPPAGNRWASVPMLAWRESRNSRKRLILFMSAISIGVAALVAIDSYSNNLTRSVHEQSRSLLGGDLAVNSRQQYQGSVDSLVDTLSRHGISVGTMTSFASMASVPRGSTTRLVQVRAVTPGVPFYGTVETQPAGMYASLHRGPNILVDPSLLFTLGAKLGDTLTLGFAQFTIIGTLKNVPGDVGVATALGPRVYIPAEFLAQTRLLSFGSRADYQALLKLPAGADPKPVVAALRKHADSTKVRVRTVEQTERNLTNDIRNLDRYLGLVGLVALLLGGIGVASAIFAYVAEKVDTVATLRCVGATSGQVLGIYLIEAAALGLIGAGIGVVLGAIVQFALPHVIGGFLPLDVTIRLEPIALLTGLAVGVWVSTMFALGPLLSLRLVSPLQAIRRQLVPVALRRRWLDPARILASAVLAASIVTIAVSRAGRLRDGLGMSAAIAIAILVLWLSAAGVSWLARRILREHWPFVVRQGVANLYRPANQTRAVILSLGFGAFLISTLYLVQTNLLSQLAVSSAASKANLVFFDVQEDQIGGLDSIVRAERAPIVQQIPIVPMRIGSLGGRVSAELNKGRGTSWALRREYRSSYRDTLGASEKIIAGTWFSKKTLPEGFFEVSIDDNVAQELRLKLGDTVTWDVQGVRVPTIVTSLRQVNWARFEPNFFVIFPRAALEHAPKSFVLLTNATTPEQRGRLQRAAVDHYPNASSIDLSVVQETISRILNKVSLAIRFMALFSLATGAMVLFSAVAASRRQRVREGVLLKTLGATKAQIGRIMLAEYAVLGALGSATGMLLSIGGAWATMHFIFEAAFRPALGPIALLTVGMMMLTIIIGVLGSRDVFRETPMAALREA
ncbi:MAG: ABC transporter permease [Gemmatimonadota bacterium]|nr:ABC transporter permease [Gemmatimonadota bacterium]